MIIGTITLITILFFGSPQEIFLIHKMDKGVKTHVEDKERRKSILTDLKAAEKEVKAFRKKRKKALKGFAKKNMDRSLKRADFQKMYDELHAERLALQDRIINKRVTLQKQLTEEEWAPIVENAQDIISKEREKHQKKAEKGKLKDNYAKLEQTIEKTITDPAKRMEIKQIFDKVQVEYEKMKFDLNTVNVSDTERIGSRDLTAEEMKTINQRLNEKRHKSFNAFMDFREELLELTTEAEWDALMKEVMKLFE